MIHFIHTPSVRLQWKRNGTSWQLAVAGNVLAYVERSNSRWLCYTSQDTGDDGLLGVTRTLAAAKAYLERHAAFAMKPDFEVELCPL